MKFASIVPVSLFLMLSASAYSQSYTKVKAEKRAIELLKEYDSHGYRIVIEANREKFSWKFDFCGGQSISLSSSDLVGSYIHEQTEKGVVKALPTVVHELTHGFVSMPYDYMLKNKICPDKEYLIFPLSSGDVLLPLTPVFPSRELSRVIPKNKQTFRFKTYITGTSSTQSQGIYGLMDEWHAYYRGTYNLFCFRKYYEKNVKQSEDWIDFFHTAPSELSAHYEFKYFILTYLSYARKNKPKIFEQIVQNNAFKVVFRHIDTHYAALIEQFLSFREQLFDNLKKQGVRVQKYDEDFFINNKGTTLIEAQEDIVSLKPELQKKELQEILALLLKE